MAETRTLVAAVTGPCPVCGKTLEVQLYKEDIERWMHGEHAQTVWPDMTPMERERLISGVCSDECWDTLFPPETR